MRAVYRYWSWLVFLAVIVQVGFAGYGAFSVVADVDDKGSVDEDMLEDGFGLHLGFGYLVVLTGLILLVLALVARHRIKQSAILAGLLIIQPPLAWIGGGAAAVGVLHPVNALVIFGLSGLIAYAEWQDRKGVSAAPLPAEPG
jgi:predicted TIM-barrel enzyme